MFNASDPVLHEQMTQFVDSARKATGADVAIMVLSSKDASRELEGKPPMANVTVFSMSEEKLKGLDSAQIMAHVISAFSVALQNTVTGSTGGNLQVQFKDRKTGHTFDAPAYPVDAVAHEMGNVNDEEKITTVRPNTSPSTETKNDEHT